MAAWYRYRCRPESASPEWWAAPAADTCEELDHLGEQAMQYLNITLREKDTQVIPFCADGTYWVPVEAGEAKDVRAEKWMEYYQCDQERFWKFQRYFYEWTGEIPKRCCFT